MLRTITNRLIRLDCIIYSVLGVEITDRRLLQRKNTLQYLVTKLHQQPASLDQVNMWILYPGCNGNKH